jgi:hypothetical protein
MEKDQSRVVTVEENAEEKRELSGPWLCCLLLLLSLLSLLGVFRWMQATPWIPPQLATLSFSQASFWRKRKPCLSSHRTQSKKEEPRF